MDQVTTKVGADELAFEIVRTEASVDDPNSARPSGLRYGSNANLPPEFSYFYTPNALSPLPQGTNVEKVFDGYAYNVFGEHTGYVAQLNLVPNAPQEVFKQSFVRDKLGRITEKTEVVNGIATTYGYGYDLAGRLETPRENGFLVRTYGFDSNSNRISLASAGGTLIGTADAQDRLLSYGPNAYSYAPNGETTTRTKAAARAALTGK